MRCPLLLVGTGPSRAYSCRPSWGWTVGGPLVRPRPAPSSAGAGRGLPAQRSQPAPCPVEAAATPSVPAISQQKPEIQLWIWSLCCSKQRQRVQSIQKACVRYTGSSAGRRVETVLVSARVPSLGTGEDESAAGLPPGAGPADWHTHLHLQPQNNPGCVPLAHSPSWFPLPLG